MHLAFHGVERCLTARGHRSFRAQNGAKIVCFRCATSCHAPPLGMSGGRKTGLFLRFPLNVFIFPSCGPRCARCYTNAWRDAWVGQLGRIWVAGLIGREHGDVDLRITDQLEFTIGVG